MEIASWIDTLIFVNAFMVAGIQIILSYFNVSIHYQLLSLLLLSPEIYLIKYRNQKEQSSNKLKRDIELLNKLNSIHSKMDRFVEIRSIVGEIMWVPDLLKTDLEKRGWSNYFLNEFNHCRMDSDYQGYKISWLIEDRTVEKASIESIISSYSMVSYSYQIIYIEFINFINLLGGIQRSNNDDLLMKLKEFEEYYKDYFRFLKDSLDEDEIIRKNWYNEKEYKKLLPELLFT